MFILESILHVIIGSWSTSSLEKYIHTSATAICVLTFELTVYHSVGSLNLRLYYDRYHALPLYDIFARCYTENYHKSIIAAVETKLDQIYCESIF